MPHQYPSTRNSRTHHIIPLKPTLYMYQASFSGLWPSPESAAIFWVARPPLMPNEPRWLRSSCSLAARAQPLLEPCKRQHCA